MNERRSSGFPAQSRSAAIFTLALAGCATYVVEPAPVKPVPAAASCASGYCKELEKFRFEVAGGKHVAPAHDHVADALIRCNQLGFVRGSDGHQNCVMRAMDRIDFSAQRYLRQDDEITVRVPRRPEPAAVPHQHVVPPAVTAPSIAPSYSGSALADCRIDPRPPCRVWAPPYGQDWGYAPPQ